MKGVIKWQQVTCNNHDFIYDIDSEEFDTQRESIRDTLMRLFTYEWDTFGEIGDCIVIDKEESEDA